MDEEFVRWGKDTKRCWGKVIWGRVETGIQSWNKNFAATRSWKRQRDSLWMSLELSTARHIALLESSSFQTSSLWPHKNKLPKCFKQFNVYLWQQDQEVRTPSKIFLKGGKGIPEINTESLLASKGAFVVFSWIHWWWTPKYEASHQINTDLALSVSPIHLLSHSAMQWYWAPRPGLRPCWASMLPLNCSSRRVSMSTKMLQQKWDTNLPSVYWRGRTETKSIKTLKTWNI